MHLLLVEDSDEDARMVRVLLEEPADPSKERTAEPPTPPSFVLRRVDRLSHGLELLDEGGIDLVLLDLNLPDERGITSVRRVIERYPNVPVVVLTGSRDPELGLQAIAAGAQDFLVKDAVTTEVLDRTVRFAHRRHAGEGERLGAIAAIVDDGDGARRAVTEEIYEGTMQQMTAGLLRATTATAPVDTVEAPVRTALTRLRDIAFDLWPPALHRLGLGAALEDFAARRLSCDVVVDEDPRVEMDHRSLAAGFMAVQRFVRAAASAGATRVCISITAGRRGTEIAAAADVRWADARAREDTIAFARERTHLADGWLIDASAPDSMQLHIGLPGGRTDRVPTPSDGGER